MPISGQVTIVSGDTLLTRLLQERLQQAGWQACRLLLDSKRERAAETDFGNVLLVMPDTWRQFHRWLSGWAKSFAAHPCLIVGDLRIAGMSLSALEDWPCLLLPAQTHFEEITCALETLCSRPLTPPTVTLKRHFAAYMQQQPTRHCLNAPTPRELECGCAVSLGLSTHQIAHILTIEEETVITHIKSLYIKFGISDRDALGSLFEEAFVPYCQVKPLT